MVAEEFLGLVGKFKMSTYVGVEDFADKLSFLFSVTILSICVLIVTIKSYFLKPLSCYIATSPGGLNFETYVENYCWVHGSIAILPGERIPQTPEEWMIEDNNKRITYYQWVPFILGLQCIMFYIPKIIWQIIYYSRTGTNLEDLMTKADTASKGSPNDRKDAVENIAKTIEDMLYQHRDYRQGRIADIRRKLYNMCNFCVISKHMGTWLVMTYLAMKVMYCINAFGQLSIMKSFLGFNESLSSFGYTILNNIANGKEWEQSGIFPRVTYCLLGNVRVLGADNQYVAQCALPINMLNEKIYIFLWFWILFVGIFSLISIPIWFLRIAFTKNRKHFIKKFLTMKNSYQRSDYKLLNHFISDFLRHDGVFLIRMIFINAGDLVTADIVFQLWEIYKAQYQEIDLRNVNQKIQSKENSLHNSCDSLGKDSVTQFV